ncbi:MAG: hypothetical protein ACRD22_16485, partial [Terriglobia bacterium]
MARIIELISGEPARPIAEKSKVQPPFPLVGVASPKTGPWPEASALTAPAKVHAAKTSKRAFTIQAYA